MAEMMLVFEGTQLTNLEVKCLQYFEYAFVVYLKFFILLTT